MQGMLHPRKYIQLQAFLQTVFFSVLKKNSNLWAQSLSLLRKEDYLLSSEQTTGANLPNL